MSVIVNTNVASLAAQRGLNSATSSLTKSLERLSTGLRINKASDDSAGLSISQKIQTQINGNSQAINNIQDGANMLQIADSSLSVISGDLQRIRELCVQAANGTYGTSERTSILDEIHQRLQDISSSAKTSSFNNIKLLTGAASKLVLQIGAGSSSINRLKLGPALLDATATKLGLNITYTSGSTWLASKASSYINVIDSAITKVTQARSVVGAYENRLSSALDNVTSINQNLTEANSRITDVDIASETSKMTKYQVLQQAATSVLS
ncbi:MAG: flagellin, partial [Candidatus Gastranaerophilaceae bacterium]